jgi:hypothetical protein
MDDINSFRKSCRQWHACFEQHARDGRVEDMNFLSKKIYEYIDKWEGKLNDMKKEKEKLEKKLLENKKDEMLIRFKLRMLAQLSIIMTRIANRHGG